MSDKFNILIVDDVEDNLHSLELIINDNFDVNIYKALDAKAAISIAMSNTIHLVLTDVQMPEINGFELAEYLKSVEKTKDIPVVLITGIYDQDKYRTKAYSLGAIEYITKPIDTEILTAKLKIYVDLFNGMRLSALEIENNEKMLLESKKLASMGEMIGFISHQLKQPLNTLSLYCQQIQLKHSDTKITDKSMSEFSKNTQDQIDYMNETIESFLDYYKPNKEKKEFLIDSVINKALDILKSKIYMNRIEVYENIDMSLKVYGVEMELCQVLLNILNNAIDQCISQNIEDANISIHVYKEDEDIVLTIEDNAGGVEQEKLSQLTNPYYTTKENGTGLGLYMVDIIIKESFKAKLKIFNSNYGLKFKIIFNNQQK